MAAGTSHAPISAILILFELTGNYDLILPLMIAAIIAGLLSRRIYPYSIYTDPLHRKGVEIPWRMEEAALAGLAVEDLLREDRERLAPGTPYREVVDRFLGTRRHRLFVVDGAGHLAGVVALHDIKHALDDPASLAMVVAHDLMTPVEATVAADDRLHRAAEVFARTDFERLPVVAPDGRFLGLLAKRDLLAVYAQEVLGRPALLATFVSSDAAAGGRDYVELPPDYLVRAVRLPPRLAGATLAEARLPQRFGARVLEIKRRDAAGREERVIPGAGTVLEAGDELVVLGPSGAFEALRREGMPEGEAEAHLPID